MDAGRFFLKILNICLSIAFFLLMVFLLFRLGQSSYDFGYRVFTEKAVDVQERSREKVVQITSDMGAGDIGSLLQRKGLVRDSGLFAVQLMLSAYKDSIKPGTYTLSTSMTAREMMQVMSAEDEGDTETEE